MFNQEYAKTVKHHKLLPKFTFDNDDDVTLCNNEWRENQRTTFHFLCETTCTWWLEATASRRRQQSGVRHQKTNVQKFQSRDDTHVLDNISSCCSITAVMADTCTVCTLVSSSAEGALQVGCQTPEGVCPKYWQRDAAGHCTESWNCLQYSNTIHRVIGSLFLLLALIYLKIMYIRRVRPDDSRARAAPTFEMPSCSFLSLSGIFLFFYRIFVYLMELYPPQNIARCFAVWHSLHTSRLSPVSDFPVPEFHLQIFHAVLCHDPWVWHFVAFSPQSWRRDELPPLLPQVMLQLHFLLVTTYIFILADGIF